MTDAGRASARTGRARAVVVSSLLVVALASTSLARAQEPTLHLTVSAPRGRVSVVALRRRLQETLSMEVELGGEGVGPVLEVIFEDDQIRLRYRDGEHDLERTTDAPAHRRERVTVIALIATNLVRDEAAALLASLEAPAPEPAAPVEPEPAPEPPEPEPPPALADPEPAPVEPPPEPALVQDAWTWPERDYLPFGIDLLPGVGFSSVYGGRERRTISLGVLGDLYGGLDGYAFAIFATIGGDVRGVQQSVGFSVAERVEG
ncbi:MAG: hypothetical protein AB7P00_24985, partial [Sandaracinaceae bacterium]